MQSILSLLFFLALAHAAPAPQQSNPAALPTRCTVADKGQLCNSGAINGFYLAGTCTTFPENTDGSQFVCLPGGTLLGTASSGPSNPDPNNPAALPTRCTAADTGKLCNSGAINGFYLAGTCTSIPENDDGSQFVCFPGGTLLGMAPSS